MYHQCLNLNPFLVVRLELTRTNGTTTNKTINKSTSFNNKLVFLDKLKDSLYM